MNYVIEKNIKDNLKLRESFVNLGIETFNLSFDAWYKKGYWTDKYIPYSVVYNEKVIANASVNIIDTLWNNMDKRYIQIGTVMTDLEFRGKGLSRRLIEEIIKDWQDKCDAIYLFANDSVLNFYPRFGFEKEFEYQSSLPIKPVSGKIRKLDMSNSKDLNFLKKYYAKSNPFSALPMIDNYELLMFHCSSFMKDCVFYCEDFDAVIIANENQNTLTCFDVYCHSDKSLGNILSAFASTNINMVILGFSPKDMSHCSLSVIDNENNTLFLLKNKDNIFSDNKIMFPTLSHA